MSRALDAIRALIERRMPELVVQTLRGDCAAEGVAAVAGQAGLEARSTRS